MICAICIIFTTCGALSLANAMTADEVKSLIDALIASDVTLENWSSYEVDVENAVNAEAELADDELATYEALTTVDGVLYSEVLDEMELIVETGSVYDAIMGLPQDEYDLGTGEWIEGINATNYQGWYEYVVDLSVEMDALTTEQQRLLGETVLARYSTAAEELLFYWEDYVSQVVSALEAVYESNVAWDAKTDAEKLADYQTKKTQYLKADQKVDALYTSDEDAYKPDQLEDVDAVLAENGISETAEQILARAEELINGIYESKMGAIVDIKDEIEGMLPISIDNCADINEKAIEALEQYNVLKDAIGATYWEELKDDALETALNDYKDESAEWMDAKAFKDVVDKLVTDIDETTITKENYSTYVQKYEEASEVYEALSGFEKALQPTIDAKAALDAVKVNLDAFADEWVTAVKDAIDAIPDFDHTTYTDQAAWADVVEKIGAARAAYNEINVLANALVAEITNYADLTAAEAEMAEIKADYLAAGAVVGKIDALGEVGDLANDDITLASRTAIDEAFAAYDGLTDTQKTLVANYADLETADDECATLETKKTEIEGYIEDFNDAKALVEYTTEDADIETAVIDATAAYDAAVAIADDTTAYGTKLASLVTTLKADKEAFDAYVDAIVDLRAKGEALVAAVDAISVNVDIRESENLEGRLVAYAVTADAIDEMNQLFAEAGTAYAAYNSAVTTIESHYGELPVEEDPYVIYEEDKSYYEEASALWYENNPTEAVAAVDNWVEAVEELFNVIDEFCESDLEGTELGYVDLVDEYEAFEILAKNYLYSNYLEILSKYDYIGIRIGQYKAAANIIETANNVEIPDRPVKYGGVYDGVTITLELYKEAVDTYEDDLTAASEAITVAYNTYNNSDTATKEIAGVDEAYEALQEKEAECTVRNAALAFDKKVIEAADKFATATHPTYEEIIALKDELAGLDSSVGGAITSAALLLDLEVDAVEDLITNIGTFDIYDVIADRDAVTDKIDAARAAYDILITDPQQINVENYQTLLDAEELLGQIDVAIAFIEAVDALEVVDEANWEQVKADAEALRVEYNDFDDVTKDMVVEAYRKLQDKQAEVVSFMLSLLPDLETVRGYVVPDDMDAIDAVIEMLYAIDYTDANGNSGGAYRELTTYSRLRVVGYAKYGVTIEELKDKLAEYNQLKANAVIEAIEAIAYYDANGNITMTYLNYEDYLDAIEAAEDAYAAYVEEIDEYRNTVGCLTTIALPYLVTNKTTMDEARADYDRFAAAEGRAADVVALLDAFYAAYPTVDDVTRDNYKTVKDDITDIEEAYAELDSLAKKFAEEGVEGLAEYTDKYYAVERYMAVYEAIDALMYNEDDTTTSMYDDIVENEAFDAEYGLIISDIEAKYEDLTPEEKIEVTNYAILETARDAYNENVAAAIAATIAAIDAIYQIAELDDFALTNVELEAAIDEANDWFNSLSADNQAEVTNADKLVAANEKIASLTDPDEVIEAIDALGDPEEIEITDENYVEITAAVEEAKALYDTLAEGDKLVVGNYSVLEVWVEKVEAFEPDRSGDINDDGVVSVTDISAMVDYVLRRDTFDDVQFERANLVVDEGEEQVIDIFDILAAIELIIF